MKSAKSEVKRRLGVDLDGKNRCKLLIAYFRARQICRNVEVYESRRGYHLRVKRPFTPLRALEIRRNLGDDPQRIKFDERRIAAGTTVGFDVLFNHDRAHTIDPLALPWKMVGRNEDEGNDA